MKGNGAVKLKIASLALAAVMLSGCAHRTQSTSTTTTTQNVAKATEETIKTGGEPTVPEETFYQSEDVVLKAPASPEFQDMKQIYSGANRSVFLGDMVLASFYNVYEKTEGIEETDSESFWAMFDLRGTYIGRMEDKEMPPDAYFTIDPSGNILAVYSDYVEEDGKWASNVYLERFDLHGNVVSEKKKIYRSDTLMLTDVISTKEFGTVITMQHTILQLDANDMIRSEETIGEKYYFCEMLQENGKYYVQILAYDYQNPENESMSLSLLGTDSSGALFLKDYERDADAMQGMKIFQSENGLYSATRNALGKLNIATGEYSRLLDWNQTDIDRSILMEGAIRVISEGELSQTQTVLPEKTPSEKPVQEPSEAPQVEPAETFSSESAPEVVDVPADTSVSASVETTSVETTADVTSDAANSGDGQTRVCLTALVQTSEGDVLHLYNIYPSDTNPHAGQDVVWMGGIGITDSVIMKSIASFNKNSSNGIWVKVYDYGDFRYTGTYGTKKYRDKALENMVAQINSGTGPDIIISTEDSASLDNSHALTNLNGYVDGISGLKREEYFDSALRAFETDGKLYSIPLGFKVNALLGNPSYVDGKTEMNYHDFSSARALLQENIMLFSGMTLESMMNMFVEGETYSWINYGSDKVTIDKSALIDMLELLKLEMINNEGEIYGMNDDYDYTLDPYPFDGFDDVYGSFAAFCPGSVNTLYEYSLGGVVGDNTEWYGYPGSSGCTPIVEASMTAGIASYSTQKDKAWDVISYLLSEEVQSEINSLQSPTPYASYVEGAIPVNIAAFRKLNELRYKQSGQGYVDETGRTILIGQAEMADLLDNYEAWLQKPLRRYVRDDEVLAVVRRVTASYLGGEINVTEAAETIEKELTSIFE